MAEKDDGRKKKIRNIIAAVDQTYTRYGIHRPVGKVGAWTIRVVSTVAGGGAGLKVGEYGEILGFPDSRVAVAVGTLVGFVLGEAWRYRINYRRRRYMTDMPPDR